MFSFEILPIYYRLSLRWRGRWRQFCSSSYGPLVLTGWEDKGQQCLCFCCLLLSQSHMAITGPVSQLLAEILFFPTFRMGPHYGSLGILGNGLYLRQTSSLCRTAYISIAGLCSQNAIWSAPPSSHCNHQQCSPHIFKLPLGMNTAPD